MRNPNKSDKPIDYRQSGEKYKKVYEYFPDLEEYYSFGKLHIQDIINKSDDDMLIDKLHGFFKYIIQNDDDLFTDEINQYVKYMQLSSFTQDDIQDLEDYFQKIRSYEDNAEKLKNDYPEKIAEIEKNEQYIGYNTITKIIPYCKSLEKIANENGYENMMNDIRLTLYRFYTGLHNNRKTTKKDSVEDMEQEDSVEDMEQEENEDIIISRIDPSLGISNGDINIQQGESDITIEEKLIKYNKMLRDKLITYKGMYTPIKPNISSTHEELRNTLDSDIVLQNKGHTLTFPSFGDITFRDKIQKMTSENTFLKIRPELLLSIKKCNDNGAFSYDISICFHKKGSIDEAKEIETRKVDNQRSFNEFKDDLLQRYSDLLQRRNM